MHKNMPLSAAGYESIGVSGVFAWRLFEMYLDRSTYDKNMLYHIIGRKIPPGK